MEAKGPAQIIHAGLIRPPFTLSLFTKRRIALSMYAKGLSFIEAAMLLRKRGGYEYVVLHLVCQGVEIILKALLLFKNYDFYWDKLPIKPFGHNLVKLATVASDEFGLRPMSKALAAELHALNALYTKHLLRYGSKHDIFINPETISCHRTLLRIYAVVVLSDRHLPATT